MILRATLVFLLALTPLIPAQAWAGRFDRQALFQGFAAELMPDLSRAGAGEIRVALWPFDADRLPIPLAVAEELNVHLLDSLLQARSGNMRFIARTELRELIAEIEATNPLQGTAKNPVAGLMQVASDVDVLVIGRMRLDQGRVSLFYQAVRKDGQILATTTPRFLALSEVELGHVQPGLPLDKAITQAVRHFAQEVPEMTEMRLSGIRYQASGHRPEFALLLDDRLAVEMATALENPLTGAKLRIQRGTLPRAGSQADGGVFQFDGTYWDLGETLDLRLSLRNGLGREAVWRGRVAKAGLRAMAFDRSGDFQRPLMIGPVGFELTTGNGPDPVYRVGERLNLMLRVDRDAWVRCYYIQADGGVVPILPNPEVPENRSVPTLTASKAYQIPATSTFPFELVIGPPLGEEVVRCFAAEQPFAGRVPAVFDGRKSGQLPGPAAAGLRQAFFDAKGLAITEVETRLTIVAR